MKSKKSLYERKLGAFMEDGDRDKMSPAIMRNDHEWRRRNAPSLGGENRDTTNVVSKDEGKINTSVLGRNPQAELGFELLNSSRVREERPTVKDLLNQSLQGDFEGETSFLENDSNELQRSLQSGSTLDTSAEALEQAKHDLEDSVSKLQADIGLVRAKIAAKKEAIQALIKQNEQQTSKLASERQDLKQRLNEASRTLRYFQEQKNALQAELNKAVKKFYDKKAMCRANLQKCVEFKQEIDTMLNNLDQYGLDSSIEKHSSDGSWASSSQQNVFNLDDPQLSPQDKLELCKRRIAYEQAQIKELQRRVIEVHLKLANTRIERAQEKETAVLNNTIHMGARLNDPPELETVETTNILEETIS